MIFNSPVFLLFLLVVVTVNYFLKQEHRSVFLLIASFVFIGYFNLESLVSVIIFSAFNFYIAKKIAGNRMLFITGVLINSYTIIIFNYFHAAKHGFDFSYSIISFNLGSLIIALGLSFYSLQNIAYLTEVYYRRMQPKKSLVKHMLYCSFFPKVICGPILFPKEFYSQIDKKSIGQAQLISGFQRLLLGLFKKMVIADRLAPAVSSVFDHNSHYNGLTTLTAAYLFTIQLYFDFSGYTDMALGTAKMLGYDLKENFNLPLRSASVAEFWRRWHISLISWFTAYVYYPVVYRLREYKKTAALIGIALTFFISGVWHGIGFTFLAWAVCHAVYLSFELLTKRFRVSLSERINASFYKAASIVIVFNAVCFSNIFFRADSFHHALQLIKNTFSDFVPVNWLTGFIAPLAVGGHQMDEFNFYISIFIASAVLVFERRINRIGTTEKLNMLFIVSCILLIMLFGVFNNGSRFIYMQF